MANSLLTWRIRSGLALPVRQPVRLGFLGDSIMDFNHTFSGTGAFALANGIGEINWASALYPHFEYDVWYDGDAPRDFAGMNGGIGGNTTSDVLARVADMQAYSPDVVLVSVGTNDVTASVPAATASANIQDICQYFLSRSIPVILATVRPRGGAEFPENLPDGDPRLTILQDLNTLIRAYAASIANVHLWDVYLAYDDGAGRPIAGYLSDGTHLARTGAYHGGASLVPVLQTLFPGTFSYIPTSTSLELNSQMTGTGGVNIGTRSSGPTATGWIAQFTGAGTATCVKSKDGNDKQVLTITPQAAGSAAETFQISRASGGITVTPGNWVKTYIRVKLGAWDGWRSVTQVSMGSSPLATVDAAAVIDAPSEVVLDMIGPPWQVPAGTTSQSPIVHITIDGTAAGTGVATVERIALFEVPDPRPLHGA